MIMHLNMDLGMVQALQEDMTEIIGKVATRTDTGLVANMVTEATETENIISIQEEETTNGDGGNEHAMRFPHGLVMMMQSEGGEWTA